MDTSKQAQQSYDAMVKKASPNSPILSNCVKAFVSGGLICVLGQALLMFYTEKGNFRNGCGTLGFHHTDWHFCVADCLRFV